MTGLITGLEILTTGEMAEADRLAVAAGVPSLTLMENAGAAVAGEAAKMVPPGARIAVLCGPGNNGGDGFVAARHLRERGFEARVALIGAREALKGDAAETARMWTGPVEPLAASSVDGAALIIDALFGAGLSRALEGGAAAAVASANASGNPILAVDVPSGLDGDTGAPAGDGIAIEATRTVTFFRRKPGHVLMPGRALCGEVIVADIGIPNAVLTYSPPPRGEGLGAGGSGLTGLAASPHPQPLPVEGRGAPTGTTETTIPGPTPAGEKVHAATWANAPALWHPHFPSPRLDAHKYDRGHAVVVSGSAESTGAARLGARGALRIGAGVVTVVGSAAATAINATQLTAIMVRAIGGDRALAEFLADTRRNAVLFGPGAGVGQETAETALTILASAAAVVLDADALTSFAGGAQADGADAGFGFTIARTRPGVRPENLFEAIRGRAVPVTLTPHEGEFKRLFPDHVAGSKLERARAAAGRSGAVVVLKGPDTVIAAPDGRAAINENAPPTLATAGSGDVLAGFIVGLLAQRMPAFEAACAAVWLHGVCANHFGAGLIAEDLPEVLPRVLAGLSRRLNRDHGASDAR